MTITSSRHTKLLQKNTLNLHLQAKYLPQCLNKSWNNDISDNEGLWNSTLLEGSGLSESIC